MSDVVDCFTSDNELCSSTLAFSLGLAAVAQVIRFASAVIGCLATPVRCEDLMFSK